MTRVTGSLAMPRVTLCGDQALLLQAEGDLSLPTQERIWSLCDTVSSWDGVIDAQPGMNSLLVLLDRSEQDLSDYPDRLLRAWARSESGRRSGKTLEVGVVYGGEGGCDLADVARYHGVETVDIVRLHTQSDYTIFAPGTVPGFGYLFGLDPRLFIPRRKVPVMRKVGGTVSIAGEQATLGVPKRDAGPDTSPIGWYVLGRALDLPVPFDVDREPMSFVALGDRVRFRVERIEK